MPEPDGYTPDENPGAGNAGRILIAGIGNVFLADDGFGVEAVKLLAQRSLPENVRVVDFGIRGMDLVYELLNEYEMVVFVDTVARGGVPGSLYLIEPRIDEDGPVTLDTHGMDPVKVLALARALGAPPHRTYVLGCEPEFIVAGENDLDIVVGLSAPVQAALDEAVSMLMNLVMDIAEVPETAGAKR